MQNSSVVIALLYSFCDIVPYYFPLSTSHTSLNYQGLLYLYKHYFFKEASGFIGGSQSLSYEASFLYSTGLLVFLIISLRVSSDLNFILQIVYVWIYALLQCKNVTLLLNY